MASSTTQHAGEDHTLTCTVSGGNEAAATTYQWLRNDSPLSEMSATLSFTPLRQPTPSSNGQYVCKGTWNGRAATSDSVTIDVTGEIGNSTTTDLPC